MISRKVLSHHVCAAAILAAAAFSPVLAQAQDAVDSDVSEIVVTAQKRAENLQDVPAVVTALGGQLLQQSGARDVRDLQLLVPGLTITSTTSESVLTMRLRGIGTVGDNPGLESSVGVVIDGVYRPRNGVGLNDLGETDRIEVLKGPQTSLYGKSVSAGVVNVITAEPKFDFAGGGELTYGNYNTYGASAWVTGPITKDTAAVRLFVAKRQRQGYLDVITGPGPRRIGSDTDLDYWTARGQLLVQNDNVKLKVIADYTGRDENCCASVQIVRGTAAASRANLVNATRPGSIAPAPDPYGRVAYSNRDTTSDTQDAGVSAQLDINLTPDITLTSITAVRHWANQRGQDSDFTAADILYRPVNGYTDHFNTMSEELRLAGQSGRLNWLVGAFYAQEDYKGEAPLLYGSDYYGYWAARVLGGAPALVGALPTNTFLPGTGQNDSFRQDNTSWALFTNNTFDITENWDITAGLRYSSDSKTLDSIYRTSGGSCGRGRLAFPTLAGVVGAQQAGLITTGLCLPWENEALDAYSGRQTRKDTEWTGTLKTSYRWSPDVMTYASYSRGFKPGGFNFDRPNTQIAFGATGAALVVNPSTAFAAETVNAYEIGAKTEWFDRRLALNLTAFHQTYDNFQLNTFVGTQFIVDSLPEVTSKGVEADFLMRSFIPGLTLQGGVTYAITDVGNFVAADLTNPSNFAGLSRLPGSRLSFAPLWSGNIAATYMRDLGGGLMGSANISAKATTGYNTGSDLAPQKYQDGFTVVNARIGLSKNGWGIELWGANLFDTDYQQVAINSPLQGTESDPVAIRTYNAFLAPPRTYGVTLRASF